MNPKPLTSKMDSPEQPQEPSSQPEFHFSRESIQNSDLATSTIKSKNSRPIKRSAPKDSKSNLEIKTGLTRSASNFSSGAASSPGHPFVSTQQPYSMQSSTPIIDYRKNVERQVREQKSVGSLLSIVVWSLLSLVVLCAGLASYGAYVIFGELKAQKVTTTQMRAELVGQIKGLQEQLDHSRQQLNEQQETVSKMVANLETKLGTLQSDLSGLKRALADETKTRSSDVKARLLEIRSIQTEIQSLRRQLNRENNSP